MKIEEAFCAAIVLFLEATIVWCPFYLSQIEKQVLFKLDEEDVFHTAIISF